MKVDGKDRRTIWVEPGGQSVGIIDQTRAAASNSSPRDLRTLADAVQAIKTMQVRGAPLIGVTAAYGVWLALRRGCFRRGARRAAYAALFGARPTAINLKWALDEMSAAVRNQPRDRARGRRAQARRRNRRGGRRHQPRRSAATGSS